jgi:hypothetical protein
MPKVDIRRFLQFGGWMSRAGNSTPSLERANTDA